MMRWLLDQGLPRTAADMLRGLGMDAVHVGEIGMASATDREITNLAGQQDRIIVTLDSDFHAILALSGANKPSVIRIREEGLKAAEVCRFITGASDLFANELLSGCVLTVTSTKARLRMLPINP
jgi:predicted nuclease of predicted toxin-antitoxin system